MVSLRQGNIVDPLIKSTIESPNLTPVWILVWVSLQFYQEQKCVILAIDPHCYARWSLLISIITKCCTWKIPRELHPTLMGVDQINQATKSTSKENVYQWPKKHNFFLGRTSGHVLPICHSFSSNIIYTTSTLKILTSKRSLRLYIHYSVRVGSLMMSVMIV